MKQSSIVTFDFQYCAGLAIGALLLGISVYVFDRQGNVSFLNLICSCSNWPTIYGLIGLFLPTLTHSFVFTIVCCYVWAVNTKQVVLMCLLWVCIELAMEGIQHPEAADFIKSLAVTYGLKENVITQYSINGTFSISDLLAAIIGPIIAFIALKHNIKEYQNEK